MFDDLLPRFSGSQPKQISSNADFVLNRLEGFSFPFESGGFPEIIPPRLLARTRIFQLLSLEGLTFAVCVL